jgi:hypothetical protein
MWLTALPRGKRAAWNGNQLLSKTTKVKGTAFKKRPSKVN